MRNAWLGVAVLLALPAPAAERAWIWREYPPDLPPAGFRSTLAGAGKPGEWKVIPDEAAPPSGTNRVVLAQLAQETIGNHFPILVFDRETYGDFKLTTQIKITGGAVEQIAGIVFHFQNESNYFVAAANAMRSNLYCYKIVEGEIAPLFGLKMPVSSGEWHVLGVQCEGNRVVFSFDDKDPIKLLVSGSAPGLIGFWTKSDSVSYFADTKIIFSPHDILAQKLVQDALKEYGRLLDLQIFAARAAGQELLVVAGKEQKTIGQSGGKTEQAVISQGIPYYARGKESAVVTLPLKDRNGEPIAAVRVALRTFAGQTEENAVIRAQTVVKYIQARVQSLEELLQ